MATELTDDEVFGAPASAQELSDDDVFGPQQAAPAPPVEAAPPAAAGQPAELQQAEDQRAIEQSAGATAPQWAQNAAGGLIDVGKQMVPRSLSDLLGFVSPLPGAAHEIKTGIGLIKDLVDGKSPKEAARANTPEALVLADAQRTEPFSRERFAAGFGTVAQLGMAAGITHGLKPKGLTERLFAEKAPETPAFVEAPIIPESLRQPEVRAAAPEPAVPQEVAELRARAKEVSARGAPAAAAKLEQLANDLMPERQPVELAPVAPEASTAAPESIRPSPQAVRIIPENKAGQWLADNAQRLFTAEGNVPKETFQRWTQRHGEVKEQSRQTAYATRDLQSALREEFGIGKGEELTKGFSKVPPEFVNQMNDALLGKTDINALPERIREPLHRMREHIDDVSKSLVREGVIPEELVAKVEGNLGTYMTRSYRVFDDVKWPEKIAPEVRNKAADVVLKDLQRSNPQATPETARAVLESMLSDWQQQGSGALLKSGGKMGSKDLTSFIARKDIPEVIRQFMGEYKDPVINYTRSVAKMSNLLGNARFLNDVRTQGMGKWLFEDGKQPASHSALIAAEGSDVMSPLNGLRTTPEIAEAFRTFGKNEQVTNAWAKAYFRLNGIAKAGKTVGSVMTQVRNTVGQGYFWLMNGHFDIRPAGGAAKSIAADIGVTNNAKWREAYKRYLRLDVVDQSAKAGELRDVIRDAALNDVNVPGLDANRTLDSVKKIAIGGPIRAYQIADDFGKIVGFENELARQKAINPKMPIAEVEKIAAERIQNTYPTYSRVPEWVKGFRRQPILGPFMTFAYESFRTAFHNLKYTVEDLASANPAQKKAGVQRLAGQMAVLGGGYAISAFSRSLLGLSVEDEDDVRRFLPRWDKNAQLAFTGVEDGKLDYINLSFANPYSYLTDPVMAVANGLRSDDEISTLMARSFGELLRPFTSEDILANSLIDVLRNTTETGGRVYNPQDTPENILADKLKHVAEALEPGTATRLRKKIVPALKGETTPYGADLDPVKEIGSELTGFKSQSLDYEQALAFKSRGFRRNDTESEGLFREVALRRGTVDSQEFDDAYINSNRQRFELWKSLYQDARAARRRGVSETAIRETLTSNGIGKTKAEAILSGQYQPYEPGDDMTKKLGRLGRTISPKIEAEISRSKNLILSGEYQ